MWELGPYCHYAVNSWTTLLSHSWNFANPSICSMLPFFLTIALPFLIMPLLPPASKLLPTLQTKSCSFITQEAQILLWSISDLYNQFLQFSISILSFQTHLIIFFTVCWHILLLTYACIFSDSLACPTKESRIHTSSSW